MRNNLRFTFIAVLAPTLSAQSFNVVSSVTVRTMSLYAVAWTMGNDTMVRGCKYTYSCCGWLTAAEEANQETENGSMDYLGGNSSKVLRYNGFGALVSDDGRGITSISYDGFGNPVNVQYEGNRSTTNVYLATGEKLKTMHMFNIAMQAGMSLLADVGEMADDMNIVGAKDRYSVAYHDNVIYRNGKLDMVLFSGGYATVSGSTVTFHYYTQDYLGNNRAVINGSTGAIEQTVAYYPCGGIIADLGNPTGGQPYKFGGKELITANGLNEYDFGARSYYPAILGFTKPDPRCEDFNHLSPYLFCGNDPVNNVDPTGEIFETIWDIGNVIYDVGAAAYNHITGNHDKAIGNWVDAGVDAAAMIIPGVPAGASKLFSTGTKAIKNIEKSSGIKNTAELASDIGKHTLNTSLDATKANEARKIGRSGRQARLKELGDDPKIGKSDRAWIKQEQKLISEKSVL